VGDMIDPQTLRGKNGVQFYGLIPQIPLTPLLPIYTVLS